MFVVFGCMRVILGHVERMKVLRWASKIRDTEVEGSKPRGRPKKLFEELTRKDLQEKREFVQDSRVWRLVIKSCPTHASMSKDSPGFRLKENKYFCFYFFYHASIEN